MSQFLRQLAFVALVLVLPFAEAADGDARSAIDVPLTKVGNDLASWVRYFDNGYEIVDLSDFKNPHNHDPMVAFWITDGSTTVRFAINLVTHDQFISEIESVSLEFLEFLEIDKLPLDADGNSDLSHCWDAGCNRLRVNREHNGHLGAVWNYYSD